MPIQITILEPGGLTDQTHRIARGHHAAFSYSMLSGERWKLNVTFEGPAGDDYTPTIGTLLRYFETDGVQSVSFSCYPEGTGFVHNVTIQSHVYIYVELFGDTGAQVAAGLAQQVNQDPIDPNATATSDSNVLTIHDRLVDGSTVTVSVDGGTPQTLSQRSQVVYAGTIDNYELDYYSNEGARAIRIECISLQSLFDVLPPVHTYLNKTTSEIFTDLVAIVILAAPLTIIAIGDVRGDVVIPVFSLDGGTTINDAIAQLVTQQTDAAGTNWTSGIDLTTPIPTICFRPPSPATVTITGAPGDILWETLKINRVRSDFRDRQDVRLSFDAFTPSGFCFAEHAAGTYTLPYTPLQIVGARITRAKPAFGSITLSAIPSPGDTIRVGNIHYTFVRAADLDNRVQWQVVLGATADQTAENIADAINHNPDTAGTNYSYPSWENDMANADGFGGGVIILRSKRCGLVANECRLDGSAFGVHFSGPHLVGGQNAPPSTSDIPLAISTTQAEADTHTQPTILNLAGQRDVTVIVQVVSGSPAVSAPSPDPVPLGWTLEVLYRRYGGDIITVEDTALVKIRAALEHGTGWYQRILSSTGIKDADAGYQLAIKTLAQYSTLPYTLHFETYRNFIFPADFLAFSITILGTARAILNALQWTVQEVQGTYIPGLDELQGYTVRHSITAIAGSIVTKTQTYLDFWRNLAATGKGPGPQPKVIIPPPSIDVLVFDIPNATIGSDVAPWVPISQSYTVLQVVVTPKISPVSFDLTGVISSDGVDLFPFTIPVAAPVGVEIIVDPANWLQPQPVVIVAETIQRIAITGGDGTKDYRGVFTVRLDVQLTATAVM